MGLNDDHDIPDLTCTSEVTGVGMLDLAHLQLTPDIPIDSESGMLQVPPIFGASAA
jgi:hypothetical protein